MTLRRSPEIEAIVRRWANAIVDHDVADMPHYLSEDDALTYVGTSYGEIWRGQVLRDGISAHLSEVPGISETDQTVEAWENGKTGWALYTCRFHINKTGKSGLHRITFVFVMERGSWKIVQHHISQPDSNIEKLGIEHAALNDLVKAAQEGGGIVQTEGMASVMFTDVIGSTALAQTVGDERWSVLIAGHFAQLREIIEAQDGQFVKSMGDGTMSSFSSARRALIAAQDIQAALSAATTEPVLSVRIGLHTGDVIQSEGDFFGTVVNKAARVASLAGAGEILLTDVTYLIAGPQNVRVSAGEHVALQGAGRRARRA